MRARIHLLTPILVRSSIVILLMRLRMTISFIARSSLNEVSSKVISASLRQYRPSSPKESSAMLPTGSFFLPMTAPATSFRLFSLYLFPKA